MDQPPAQASTGGRLLNTFLNRPIENHISGWSDLWDSGESGLWDRGKASPALVDLIEREDTSSFFDPFTQDGRRKKALVPGCGRGYDAVMLALHGFDVVGLEVSETAVREAEIYAAGELSRPSSCHFGEGYCAPSSKGSVRFELGDFLNPRWPRGDESDQIDGFDLVYDYTVSLAHFASISTRYLAMAVQLSDCKDSFYRKKWAESMARVIKPQGLLVCLEFPMYKDPKLPGPPWGLKGVHWNLLARGGDGIITQEVGGDGKESGSCDARGGHFQRILYIKPPRSYEVAKGTDMISVYARK
ncbi:hypothetical protein N7539_006739 [Penicillium diatomitis]|uniref:S-adenosyl-L-methionine-dependent methyltransferase n=1 Tax=Penicillium diatomitis TaxID=2819901 RepID=A0A9X0BS83_9EURO|nr:uncharacterized protein N7539_006739 [Penicillium diatomitis]KAJ5480845.1 hypothetical protein N7539_006739 [Penicillium diatomitis]